MSKNIQTAGGLIARRRNGVVELLLINGADAYKPTLRVSIPKGHIDPGETEEVAAVREVREETGLQHLTVGKKLGVVTRQSVEKSGQEVTKDIHVFHITTADYNHGPADEVYVWMPAAEAVDTMYFPEEAAFLRSLDLERLT